MLIFISVELMLMLASTSKPTDGLMMEEIMLVRLLQVVLLSKVTGYVSFWSSMIVTFPEDFGKSQIYKCALLVVLSDWFCCTLQSPECNFTDDLF